MLAAVLAAWPCQSCGQGISREYTIKAAYLQNFGHYVRRPAGSFRAEDSPLVIGVLGVDPVVGNLDALAADRRIDGRRIEVRRLASLQQYTACHILFIPRTTGLVEQLRAIRRWGDSPVLLVGETPGFAYRGGVINFFVEGNNVRFEINQQAARRGQLMISAKLSRLGVAPRDHWSQAWEEVARQLQQAGTGGTASGD